MISVRIGRENCGNYLCGKRGAASSHVRTAPISAMARWSSLRFGAVRLGSLRYGPLQFRSRRDRSPGGEGGPAGCRAVTTGPVLRNPFDQGQHEGGLVSYARGSEGALR
jgi:hypothetical protein